MCVCVWVDEGDKENCLKWILGKEETCKMRMKEIGESNGLVVFEERKRKKW